MDNDAIVNIIRHLDYDDRRRYMTVSKFWASTCLDVSRELSPYGRLYDIAPNTTRYLGGCRHTQLHCFIHGDAHLLTRSKVRMTPECLLIAAREGRHDHLDALGPDAYALLLASCTTDIYRHYNTSIAPSVITALSTCKVSKAHFTVAARSSVPQYVHKVAALVTKHDPMIKGDEYSLSSLMVHELLACNKWFTLRKWVKANKTRAAETAIEAHVQGDHTLSAHITQLLKPLTLRNTVQRIIKLDKTMFDCVALNPQEFLMMCIVVFAAALHSPQVGYFVAPLIERIADKFDDADNELITGQDLIILTSLRFWTLFSEILQMRPRPDNTALTATMFRCAMSTCMQLVFVNNLPADPLLLDQLICKCDYPLDVSFLANVMFLEAQSETRIVCLLTDVDCECAMLRELLARGFITEGDALGFACRRYKEAESKTSMDFIRWMSVDSPVVLCAYCLMFCKNHLELVSTE